MTIGICTSVLDIWLQHKTIDVFVLFPAIIKIGTEPLNPIRLHRPMPELRRADRIGSVTD